MCVCGGGGGGGRGPRKVLSEIVTRRFLAEGSDSKCREVCIWSG